MRAFLFIQTLAKGSLVSESFPVGSNLLNDVKFMFSKKATKIDEIFTVDLTLCSNCQIVGEDFVKLSGLHRKYKLYQRVPRQT